MKRNLFLFFSLFLASFLILFIPLAKIAKPFFPFVSYLLGTEKPTSYLILLGNDSEMRANGGFAGSYAKLTLSHSKVSDLSFQDIYVPNGQIAGLYVAPPAPIQQAFGHGSWELANADWQPSFPEAAKDLRWFLEKGGEINPDNLVLLNLSTIKKILNLVGSFSVPEYGATLNPDNMYLFLQGKVELNFFPGSTQKKDVLTAVGRALYQRVYSLSLVKKFQIAQVLYSDFLDQNILLNSRNEAFQNLLVQQNLAGVLEPKAQDTYSLVETNLGANKANAFVSRQTTHTISIAKNSPLPEESPRQVVLQGDSSLASTTHIHHSVTVHFTNSSPAENPNPPFNYGGNYIAYLRFYFPADATNINVSTTSAQIQKIYGLTEVGFWHTTLAGNESTVSLSYDLPASSSYTLAILKQHGLVSSPQTIHIFDKTYSTDLTTNFFARLQKLSL